MKYADSSGTFGLWALLCASVCLAVVSAQSTWMAAAENAQQALISKLVSRQASQQLHIVEVDAASIAAIGKWPFPRDHYARLVQELDAAGVRSIVFDIDFSSRASRDTDAALASAIAAANASIVMPTFSQAASEYDERRLDALPIPELRENVSLASASVRPDRDTLVRRMVYGTVTDGTARPSISTQISGGSGSAHSDFLIDFGIEPSSIPRHSFFDIESGAFNPPSLAGKDVIVGATAIELGDRYGVPVHGVIPGVTIQALAAETLISGPIWEAGWVPFLILAAIGSVFVGSRQTYTTLVLVGVSFGIMTIILQAAFFHVLRMAFDVLPALVLLILATCGQGFRIARKQLWQKGLMDIETRLPNAFAFSRSDNHDREFLAAAYIKDFDAIQSVIGKDNIGALFERLIERIGSVGAMGEVYRADTRIVAWHPDAQFDAVEALFEDIAQKMRKPLEVGGKRIDVTLTFGVAAKDDLTGASRAASHAAEQGRLWHAHEHAEALILERRMTLMGELDEAVEANQLQVVYQPKLRFSSGAIESVEALVRWDHPVRGRMRPDLFIPLAEENNRIEPLTLFVLRQTINDLARWRETDIDLSAAINISATLIGSDSFIRKAEMILKKAAIPLDRVILEVTESATLADPAHCARNLRRFRDLGVAISMDDYGTGQSTLSYLQLLPLTELKIDRAFVQYAYRERSDALLVHSTIQLAHSLGLKVVGEGVEDKQCLDFLRQAGCDYAQGYHITKPLPFDDLVNFLGNNQYEAAA